MDGVFRVILPRFLSREFFYVINPEIINNMGAPWGPSIKLMYFLIPWKDFPCSRFTRWSSKEIKNFRV